MTTERWTDETLDRFASTITTAIAASNERLTRIEQLQGSNAEAIAASNERLTRTEQLLDSAARSIQAMLDSMVEERQERHELREATIRLSGVSEGIANLLASLDSDRPTILRKLNAIENKVDRILEKEDRQAG
jgi:uncharacterized protein YigA (DUF484 family)